MRRRRSAHRPTAGLALAVVIVAAVFMRWPVSALTVGSANAVADKGAREMDAATPPHWIGLTPPAPGKGALAWAFAPPRAAPDIEMPPQTAGIDTSAFERAVHDGPVIAIIIDDMGLSRAQTKTVAVLPPEVTFSFLPYGIDAPALARDARAGGHEIMLHMPMEPVGHANPGPGALVRGLSGSDIDRRTQAALLRFDGLVGVNNHMGSRMTQDRAAMALFARALRGRGLIFVDSRTSERSVAAHASRAGGITTAERDVFLDHHGGGVSDVLASLASAERIARVRGAALAIGHPRTQTAQAIAAWLPHAQARGVRLVPLSTYVRVQSRLEILRVANADDRDAGVMR